MRVSYLDTVAALTMAAVCLVGAKQVQAQTQPLTCASATSDSDGDGWGWENGASCRVGSTNTSTGSTPSASDCIDTDGDGWGWDGFASCRVGADTGTGTGTGSDSTVTSTSNCVDTDGDGWGWDGFASCRIGADVGTGTGSGSTDTGTAAVCIDSDGDGWGWDGTASCRVSAGGTATGTGTGTGAGTGTGSGPDPIDYLSLLAGYYACGNGIAGGTWEYWLREDGTGFEHRFPNINAIDGAIGRFRAVTWEAQSHDVFSVAGQYPFTRETGARFRGAPNETCALQAGPSNNLNNPFNTTNRCEPDTRPTRERFGWNGEKACVVPLFNQLRDYYPQLSDTVPTYECTNNEMSAKWQWVFDSDYTLRDLLGVNTGDWVHTGSFVGITNQNGESTGWQLVGDDIAISWGNCQHIGGPSLDDHILTLNPAISNERLFVTDWDQQNLGGRHVSCDFLTGEAVINRSRQEWRFYRDGSGLLTVFGGGGSGNVLFDWSVENSEYKATFRNGADSDVFMLTRADQKVAQASDGSWWLLPDNYSSLSTLNSGWACTVQEEEYDVLWNIQYQCPNTSSQSNSTRILDGLGGWTQWLFETSNPLVTTRGGYTVISDRYWWTAGVTDYNTPGWSPLTYLNEDTAQTQCGFIRSGR